MSIFDYRMRKVPSYYSTMYKDDYTPEEILYALHRDMINDYEERNSLPTFKLVSKIEVK